MLYSIIMLSYCMNASTFIQIAGPKRYLRYWNKEDLGRANEAENIICNCIHPGTHSSCAGWTRGISIIHILEKTTKDCHSKLKPINNNKFMINRKLLFQAYVRSVRRSGESDSDPLLPHVHLIFYFAQSVSLPHYILQMGPLYFLSGRYCIAKMFNTY